MGEGLVDARCTVHPEEVAIGTCSRCGGFVCESCMSGAVCELCEIRLEREAPPRGFGGWLVFPMLTLVVIPVAFIFRVLSFIASVQESGGVVAVITDGAGWAVRAFIEVMMSAGLVAWLVFLVPGFITKRRVTINRMEILYGLTILTNLASNLIRSDAHQEPLSPVQIITAVLWIWYFRSSKRVQQTFTR